MRVQRSRILNRALLFLVEYPFFVNDNGGLILGMAANHHEKIDCVHHFAKLIVNFIEKYVSFEVSPRDVALEVPRDPGMLQGLINCVSETWFWMTQLAKQVASHRTEMLVEFEILEIHDFVLVRLDCLVLSPERMLPVEHLVHDEPNSPDIN